MIRLLKTENAFSVLSKYFLKHHHFHEGFTEVFIDVGVTWVPEIQYCFLREKTNVKLYLTYSIGVFLDGCFPFQGCLLDLFFLAIRCESVYNSHRT